MLHGSFGQGVLGGIMNDDTDEKYESALPGGLGAIDLAISKAEAVILASGVLLMALNTCVNVIARFVYGQGLFVSGEINRVLIVLITFAGIGYAARHGRHIRMSAIYDALPETGRKILMTVIAFVTGLIMFFLCYFSLVYIASLYETGRILPALSALYTQMMEQAPASESAVRGVPVWLIYVWVPVGFAVTGIQYFLTGIKNLTAKDVYLSTGVVDSCCDTETEI
jgi:TRAP-type C4-dicarboxylate transport system permease small subunit